MRILGGIAKGKRIYTSKGCLIRPTSDKIKKSLFDMICPLEGMTFLDLYSGSGSIGLEALSRGAKHVVFAEKNVRLKEAINKNICECGFEDKICKIFAIDAQSAINFLSRRRTKFDVIFADPPYEKGWVSSTMQLLETSELLADGGLIILQHSCREALNAKLNHLQLINQKKYGDTILSFFRKYPLLEDTL
jgi:16S rRNA (guanine(966)-N(2))-methyltransferase RsmD